MTSEEQRSTLDFFPLSSLPTIVRATGQLDPQQAREIGVPLICTHDPATMLSAEIVIRKSVAADRESLMALMIELQDFERQFADRAAPDREFAAWYIDRLSRVVEDNDGLLLVATKDGAPCGFVAGFPEEEPELRDWYFYVAELVVSESERSRGIGRRLILAMEDAARARGLKRIGIGVLAGSDRVHRLYTTLGYRDYAISLRKELPP